MGCVIGDYNQIEKLELKNEINDESKLENEIEKQNINESNINTVKGHLLPDNSSVENFHLNNTNSAIALKTSLFSSNKISNLIKENTLILKLTNENQQIIETLIINKNILTTKETNIKIEKNNINEIIYSFGCGNANENSVSSSSFSSSNPDKNENEVDFIIDDIFIKSHQFDIEFNKEKYYIKDFNKGNGVFLKIEQQILIEPEIKYTFLIYNNCYIDFIVKPSLNYVIVDVNNGKKEKFQFKEKKCIIIGKSKKNDIVLPYIEGISRVQLTFYYDIVKDEFFIFDGFYSFVEKISKPSTNGIWLLINSKLEIKNNMIFRTGKHYIHCKIKGN
jgi:pSer/pThr/pTyr-binding forkhead associated (FHA) protein